MNKKKVVTIVGAICMAVNGITACNKANPGTDPAVDHTAAAGGPNAQDQNKSATATTDNTKAKPSVSGQAMQAEQQLPQLAAAQHRIDLEHMTDTVVICTVNTAPITVGEYRRQLRMQAEQVRAQIAGNPAMLNQLLETAKAMNITLTDKEKQQLTANAKKALRTTAGVLTKYLAQNHITEQQFDEQIQNMGLAEKTAYISICQSLLGELVDRELLCAAGRTAGLGPEAFNKYTELKKAPEFQQLLKGQLMSQDQMKDETIKTELMQLMMKKIRDKAPATDAQISDFYQKNLDKFKHGERIRLAQIFIAAPTEDSEAGASMKKQIHAAEPKLSPAELDAKTKATEDSLRQRAMGLLARAIKGEDFAKLANENTDDIPTRAAKLGGDMGYQEKDHLIKDFADRVVGLKSGTLYPKLIQSKLGFHIVKVTDQQPPGVLPLDEVKDIVRQGLTQNNANASVATWLFEQRKSAQIALSPEFQQLVSAAPQKPIKAKAD